MGGPQVGCQLKFYYFVDFDLCRLSVKLSQSVKMQVNYLYSLCNSCSFKTLNSIQSVKLVLNTTTHTVMFGIRQFI